MRLSPLRLLNHASVVVDFGCSEGMAHNDWRHFDGIPWSMETSMTGTLDRNLKRTSTFISVGMSPSYIDAMLELYGLKQCRPALAPGTDALRKQLDCEPLDPEDHKRYRRAVGQLLWLSSVRPASCVLSRN